MKQSKAILKIAILSGSILVASAAAITADIPRMVEAILKIVKILVEVGRICKVADRLHQLKSDFFVMKIESKKKSLIASNEISDFG